MLASALALAAVIAPAPLVGDGPWFELFNGRDLSGWTPKITGHALGEDPYGTFTVEDGILKVGYSGYDSFQGRFGHLFFRLPFSAYRIRLEYRFVGDQISGGPGWAYKNSGIMIHCQDPATMRVEQDFPVSIEVQLLGGDEGGERPTGNLCTPGTNVVMEGKLHTQHCTNSTSATYTGSQWVTAEVEVLGSGKITHYIEGEKVLEYEGAQLDPNDGDAKALIKGGDLMLSGGYISLQSESHGVEFRKVEIMDLSGAASEPKRSKQDIAMMLARQGDFITAANLLRAAASSRQGLTLDGSHHTAELFMRFLGKDYKGVQALIDEHEAFGAHNAIADFDVVRLVTTAELGRLEDGGNVVRALHFSDDIITPYMIGEPPSTASIRTLGLYGLSNNYGLFSNWKEWLFLHALDAGPKNRIVGYIIVANHPRMLSGDFSHLSREFIAEALATHRDTLASDPKSTRTKRSSFNTMLTRLEASGFDFGIARFSN